MVMEAPPSPQSVGREFVRQYYTLLNKAPTHLHRFYNNQSSFIHGGLDPPNRETCPIIGQKQIHQKIQQLNFRDCHAKITQVDAQATLGNGVVVQVTGELSNAGQPMRRFTQTFVLAAQSPKKYYVHNDIFRYQDEIVSDDECETECRSEPEEELVQERPIMNEVTQITPQAMSYYNPNQVPLQPNLNPVPHHHVQPPSNMSHVIPTPAVSAVNGMNHPEDMNIMQVGPPPQLIAAMQPPTMASPMVNLQPALPPSLSPLIPIEDPQQSVEELPIDSVLDTNYGIVEDTMDLQEISQDSVMSNEPKTYATLLKSSGNPYTNMPPMQSTYNPPLKSVSPPLQQNRYENRDSSFQGGNQMSGSMGQRMGGNRGPRNNQQTRPPRQDSYTGSGKNSFSEEGITNYDDRKKTHGNTSFLGSSDLNELFLGNLPQCATEDELRDIFTPFGTILELRIYGKPGAKGGFSVQRNVPCYGFLTYENQQAVLECLAARPFYYPNNEMDGGTALNVELKKPKDRMPYMGGGNRMGPDNRGPGNRDNGPRRGPGQGIVRNTGGPSTGGGINTGRPNNINRPPPNRNSNNMFNNRR